MAHLGKCHHIPVLSVVFCGFGLCHRFFFRSGNIEHPEDKLFNTTVEVLPFDVSVLVRAETRVEWEEKEDGGRGTTENCQENLECLWEVLAAWAAHPLVWNRLGSWDGTACRGCPPRWMGWLQRKG